MSCIRSCYDKDSSNFEHDDCTTCIHGDRPQQRTWVGLNWDDTPEIYVGDIAFLHGAKWAEAKLKEKNT